MNNIVNDVKSKTGFDLSRAKLMVYIDYSTCQLGPEEVIFLADDISQFIEQTKSLNFEVSEIRMPQCKLYTINKLIIKAKRNKRLAKVRARNINLYRSCIEHRGSEIVMHGYFLSNRGGDEFHQGDVSIEILPELSLILVTIMHW